MLINVFTSYDKTPKITRVHEEQIKEDPSSQMCMQTHATGPLNKEPKINQSWPYMSRYLWNLYNIVQEKPALSIR